MKKHNAPCCRHRVGHRRDHRELAERGRSVTARWQIRHQLCPDYAEHGFRCPVHGVRDIVLADHIDKCDLRLMGEGAAYNFIAMA